MSDTGYRRSTGHDGSWPKGQTCATCALWVVHDWAKHWAHSPRVGECRAPWHAGIASVEIEVDHGTGYGVTGGATATLDTDENHFCAEWRKRT